MSRKARFSDFRCLNPVFSFLFFFFVRLGFHLNPGLERDYLKLPFMLCLFTICFLCSLGFNFGFPFSNKIISRHATAFCCAFARERWVEDIKTGREFQAAHGTFRTAHLTQYFTPKCVATAERIKSQLQSHNRHYSAMVTGSRGQVLLRRMTEIHLYNQKLN